MAKYILKDDVIEMLSSMQGRCNTRTALVQNSKIWQQIKDLSSIDIIKCNDCINYLNNHLCLHWSRHGTIETNPDDFCSYGEKL